MTGTYKAIVPVGLDRILAIKASLTRDGIMFEEEISGNMIVIRASGTPKPRKAASKIDWLPAKLTPEQCTRRLAEAKHSFSVFHERLKSNLREQYQERQCSRHSSYSGYRKRMGHAIAVIVAQHKATRKRMNHAYSGSGRDRITPSKADYRLLDAAAGRRVRRMSQLPAGCIDYLEWLVNRELRGTWKRVPIEHKKEQREPFWQTWAELKADIEHWREMERLAGR